MKSSAEPLASQISRSLALMRRDHPEGYDRMVQTSGNLRVNLRVGSEVCGVEFGPRPRIGPDEVEEPDVEISSARETVAAVMSGDLSLGEAVSSGRLRVRGPVDAVVQAHDVLAAFIAAAIHSPRQQSMERTFVGSTRLIGRQSK